MKACSLSKEISEEKTHYVDRFGNEYPINEYTNHGKGGIYRGFKDLPKEGYPYIFKYKKTFRFKCCELCSCIK